MIHRIRILALQSPITLQRIGAHFTVRFNPVFRPVQLVSDEEGNWFEVGEDPFPKRLRPIQSLIWSSVAGVQFQSVEQQCFWVFAAGKRRSAIRFRQQIQSLSIAVATTLSGGA